jgi:DNA-binding NarL/FixJ family response regulator
LTGKRERHTKSCPTDFDFTESETACGPARATDPIESRQTGRDAVGKMAEDGAGLWSDPVARLTPTQFKVMQGVRSGQLNKQIAFDLGIAEKTVKAHMTALMRKLNVRNRTQVAVAAQSLLASRS